MLFKIVCLLVDTLLFYVNVAADKERGPSSPLSSHSPFGLDRPTMLLFEKYLDCAKTERIIDLQERGQRSAKDRK